MSKICSYLNDLERLKNFKKESKSSHQANPIPLAGLEGIEVILIKDMRQIDLVLALPTNNLVGIDIETAPLPKYEGDKKAGLDPYRSEIRLVQLYNGSDRVFVIDIHHIPLCEIKPLIERLTLVAHNALFELKHFLHAGITPSRLGCSMLLIHALTGRQISLKDASKEYLRLSIKKYLQTSDWSSAVLSQEQINYAALDAVLTHRLFSQLFPRINSDGGSNCYRLMRDAQRAIAKMELAGFYFDTEGHGQILRKWNSELLQQTIELQSIMGPGINFSSPQQVGSWLKETVSQSTLDGWPKTDKGLLKTDIGVLSLFPDLPFARPLISYREKRKLITSYGSDFASHKNPITGRIHASFRLTGTATGRLACSKPNIQNPPRDPAFRRLFRAPPGSTLIIADYSQIELRVAALVANDQSMIHAYETGEDLHKKTAAAVLKKDPEKITKAERQLAKAVNFGLLYGQGAKGLTQYAKQSYGVEMSLEQAEQARRAFFSIYPDLKRWQRTTAAITESIGYVSTPIGRKRDLSSEAYKYTESLNTPIQGGAAEVMLKALIRLEKALNWQEAYIVNCVHDEIVIECRLDYAKEIKELTVQCMQKGFLDVFPRAESQLNDLVDANICENWSEK